jgi:alcohol dehydrogenase class IV
VSAGGREQGAPPGFVWRDAGRTVLFGRGGHETTGATPAEHGFEGFALLTTTRALAGAESLAGAAAAIHEVPPGPVPDAAGGLLDRAGGATRLVALGGGRVIDTAKAIAAVTGARVAAIPTTMSGAEMTAIHRLPAGREAGAGGLVRPALVVADPGLMTSLPEDELRASSMNALAHGADSLYTPFANPVSRMTALRGAGLIAAALDEARESRPAADLALGSLLCGYAIDSALFALHHVVCQTLVRVCGSLHAETNASVLPETMAAMRRRAPDQIDLLAREVGSTRAELPARLRELGRPAGLGAAGADPARLEEALDAIEARPQLANTPDPPDRSELRGMVQAAW